MDIKIAIYHPKFMGTGGVSRAAYEFVKNVVALSYNVYIFSHSNSGRYSKKNLKWYLVKRELSFPAGGIERITKYIVSFIIDIFRTKMEVLLNKKEIDILFINGMQAIDFDILDKRIKKVLIFLGSTSYYKNSEEVQEIKKYFNSFEKVIYLSEKLKNEWCEILKLNPIKCGIIFNSLNEDKLFLIKKKDKKYYQNKLRFNKNRFNIVCVGNLSPNKGQDILVENFVEINKRLPKLELYFIGGINGYDVLYEIKNKGISNYHYLGYRRNIEEYIYAADALIVTSKSEAQPLVILEAMYFQTLVIASNVGGIEDIIGHKRTGYLFDRENLISLLEIFDRLTIKTENQRLSRNAFLSFKGKYSKIKQGIEIVHLLNSLYEKK